MKTKSTKKQGHAPHPWTELSKLTLFTIPQLRVLNEHHKILHGFCVDPEEAPREDAQLVEQERDDDAAAVTAPEAHKPASESSLDMSFEQYALTVRSLTKYGSSTQQFEYLAQTYATENERGISRTELFQLLQDHYKAGSSITQTTCPSGTSSLTETRHFERLYTWLKKHFNVYDRTRCGYLSLHTALEMLQTHPDALLHLQLQVEPFFTKLDENSKQYYAKAQAAGLTL